MENGDVLLFSLITGHGRLSIHGSLVLTIRDFSLNFTCERSGRVLRFLMNRPRRNIERVNYYRMAEGGYSDGEVSVIVDDDSFYSEEEEEDVDMEESKEEGEVVSDEEEIDFLNMSECSFDLQVQMANAGDEVKIMQLLAMKEKRCEHRKELWNEQLVKDQKIKKEEERAKRKRLREMQEKFRKLQKTESTLNKSLATASANSTPAASPKKSPVKKRKVKSPKVTSTVKKHVGVKRTRKTKNSDLDPRDAQEIRGEKTLSSILKLRQGKNDNFAELMSKAMTSNQNLEKLGGKKLENLANFQSKFTKGTSDKHEIVREHKSVIANQVDNRGQVDPNALSDRLRLVNEERNDDFQLQLLELLREIKDIKVNTVSKDKKDIEIEGSSTNSSEYSDNCKKSKPVSGKLAKPDDTDIKKPVKYAHEKLDPRHAKDRVFDKLTFPLLIAGELELACREEASQEERQARVNIAKVISYHKLYLSDEDLKTGYATVLNKVEQGTQTWGVEIANELHELLDYRAAVISRERMQAIEQKMNKPSSQNNSKKNENKSEDSLTETGPEDPEY